MTRWIVMVLMTACGTTPGLSTADRAVINDVLESVDADGTIVDQVEVTLSGTVDPALSPDAAAADSALAAEARLTPSTCIDSMVQGNVVTHMLAGCTGPRGRMLAGTIVSTWTQDGACLRVEHTTTSFTIGVRPATGSLGVTICRSESTETRTRNLSFEASTRNDEPISLTGTWDVSVDRASNCATQSGALAGQIGDRMIDRTDTDLAWCAGQAKRAQLDDGASIAKLVGGSIAVNDGNGPPDQYPLYVRALGGGEFEISDADGNILSIVFDGTDT